MYTRALLVQCPRAPPPAPDGSSMDLTSSLTGIQLARSYKRGWGRTLTPPGAHGLRGHSRVPCCCSGHTLLCSPPSSKGSECDSWPGATSEQSHVTSCSQPERPGVNPLIAAQAPLKRRWKSQLLHSSAGWGKVFATGTQRWRTEPLWQPEASRCPVGASTSPQATSHGQTTHSSSLHSINPSSR